MKAYKYQVRVDTLEEGFVPYSLVDCFTLAEPYCASVYMHNFGDSWSCLEDHNNLDSALERADKLNRQFDLVANIVRKQAFCANDIEALRDAFDVDEYLNWSK